MRNLWLAIAVSALLGGIFGAVWEQVIAGAFYVSGFQLHLDFGGVRLMHLSRAVPWILWRAATDHIVFALGIVVFSAALRKLNIPRFMCFPVAIVLFVAARVFYIVVTETDGYLDSIWWGMLKAAPDRLVCGCAAWGVFQLLESVGVGRRRKSVV